MAGRTKTAVVADASVKRNRALQMRIAGASYDQIAGQVGYASRGAAHKAVSTALKDIPREAADELRQIEIDRYDAIQIRLMSQLAQGDLSVVSNLLKLSEQRTRLLGLDRPAQVEMTHAIVAHDDPASVKLQAALTAAVERREMMLAEVIEDESA